MNLSESAGAPVADDEIPLVQGKARGNLEKELPPAPPGKRPVVRFCDGIIEAGWLVSMALVPLFFNIFSSQVFEPDKATILRMIAALLALVWLLKAVWSRAESSQEIRRLREVPFLMPILLILVSYGLSCSLSLDPGVSWFGSYERRQGALTFLSCLLIFLLLATHLRGRSQVRRLLFTQALTSVAVSAYAIAQFFEVDPLPWGSYFRSQSGLRVTSTLGNPIFLGAFLLLPFFLTLGWALWIWLEGRDARCEGRDAGRRGLLLVLLAVLAIQSLGLVLTSSRGPVLGLLSGVWVLLVGGLLLYSQRGDPDPLSRPVRRARFLSALVLIGGLALPLALAALYPGRRSEDRQDESRLSRLLHLDSPTVFVRTLIWESVPAILSAETPLEYPDGSTDRFHPLRAWAGFGPGMFAQAFSRHYPPELGSYEKRRSRPDRAHNEPLQVLVTRGWFGFLTFAILIFEILRRSAGWLGLTGNRNRKRAIVLWLSGCGAGATVLCWLLTPAFLGFGLLGGLLAGFLVFWWFAGRTTGKQNRVSRDSHSARCWLILIFLAALVSHWTEIQTGFPITTTNLYFWIVCALLAVIGQDMVSCEGTGDVRIGWEMPKRVPEAGVTSLILITLCFDFVGNWDRSDSALERVLTGIAGRSFSGWLATLPNLFLILVLVWTFGLALFLLSRGTGTRSPGTGLRAGLSFGLFSLGPAYLFLSIQALYPAAVRIFPGETGVPAKLLSQSLQTGLFLGSVAILWVSTALLLWRPGRRAGRSLPKTVVFLLAFLPLAAWTSAQGIRTLRADILLKQAQGTALIGRPELSEQYLEQMVGLRPRESHYHTAKGVLELERAERTPDPERRRVLFDRSRKSLETAWDLDPLDLTSIENLSVLYRTEARFSTTPEERRSALQNALVFVETALRLSPGLAYLYNEMGNIRLALGDHRGAEEAYRQSLRLDGRYPATYLGLGIVQRVEAETLIQGGDVEGARRKYAEAVETYEALLVLTPGDVTAHSALAFLKWQLGRKEESITEHLEVLRLQPKNLRSHRRLAEIYYSMGRTDESHQFLERGLELSPSDPALLELKQKLERESRNLETGSGSVP